MAETAGFSISIAPGPSVWSGSNNTSTINHPMKQQIQNYIKAGYSGLYLVSHEEQRVEAELKSMLKP